METPLNEITLGELGVALKLGIIDQEEFLVMTAFHINGTIQRLASEASGSPQTSQARQS